MLESVCVVFTLQAQLCVWLFLYFSVHSLDSFRFSEHVPQFHYFFFCL